MNLIYFTVLLLLTISSLVNALRWSRIAQREHYIPGYVGKFYFRWVKLIPFNNLYFFLTIIFMIISLWNPYTAILVAILSLLLPRGLSFDYRTSKVEQTERIKRLNIVYFILILLISLASVLLEYGYFLALLANVFSFFIYDQALKLTKNFEKNQSQVFVDRAEAKLETFTGPIVSITGSYSKTTTKNTLNQILSTTNNIFVTPESYNNRLGIAKSINENLKSTDEIAIFEMGTYGFGEIREMCSWVKPHISVITGIAPVHLERMKTLENILDAKSEIVDLTGTVVINGDDELLLGQARLWTAQKMVIDCSTTFPKAVVYVEYENNEHSIYISGKYITSVKGPKILQLSISLSVGIMIALEMDILQYFNKLTELEKTSHRQTILKGNLGQTIIDNSFNSNPISNISSLDLISSLETEGKKYLITPGMIELGTEQFIYNYEFAHNASTVIDEALVVGYTNKASLMLSFEENKTPVKFFKNRDLAVSYLNSVVKDDDVVLFENDLPDHHP
jgi:UDP-N-acetylmuramoyl-tripeptide--D-alanyl-D-alanine ligase